MGLVPNRITDAWGYDKTTRTWFLCEIKVERGDLHKAVTQIHDTCNRFKPKNHNDKVIPVVAIPNQLYISLQKYYLGSWNSFRSLCKITNIAIWIVEQSNIKQIQGPKPQKPKSKVTAKPKRRIIKKRPIRTRSSKAKSITKKGLKRKVNNRKTPVRRRQKATKTKPTKAKALTKTKKTKKAKRKSNK